MDSNDRGILTLLAKAVRDLREQFTALSREPGPPGKDGIPGKDGLDGKDGVGIRGLAGADGADGARGQDGPQGVPGADGERGPVGTMPKHEWKGTKLRFQQTDNRWGKWVDLQGKPGKAGSGGVFVGASGGSAQVQTVRWADITGKPDLVPAGGENIKTINGVSMLGPGNIELPKITVSATEPENPEIGDIWISF